MLKDLHVYGVKDSLADNEKNLENDDQPDRIKHLNAILAL
jgi:hypothetical protein